MDTFTFEIGLTLGVVAPVLVALLKEWAPPDVIALSCLGLVVAFGLVPMEKMTEVFKNEAPITIAALFVIGGVLESCGAVDRLGARLKNHLGGGPRTAILCFSLLAAFCSAWMNICWITACLLIPFIWPFSREKKSHDFGQTIQR